MAHHTNTARPHSTHQIARYPSVIPCATARIVSSRFYRACDASLTIPLSPAPTLAGETATRLRPSNVPKGRVAEQFYSQQHGKQTCRVYPVGRALRRWNTACGLTGTIRIEGESNLRSTAKLFPMLERLGSETASKAKYNHWLKVSDCWSELTFKDYCKRARVVSGGAA